MVESVATNRKLCPRISVNRSSSRPGRLSFSASNADAWSFCRAWEMALFVTAQREVPSKVANISSSKVCKSTRRNRAGTKPVRKGESALSCEGLAMSAMHGKRHNECRSFVRWARMLLSRVHIFAIFSMIYSGNFNMRPLT